MLKNLKVGQLTGIYLIWYSLGRMYIEGLRTDSLMLGNARIAQLVSVIFIIIGIVLILKGIFNDTEEGKYKRGVENAINF